MNQATSTQADAYIPGVCNINYEEIANRKKTGHFGIAIFVVLLAVMVGLDLSRWIRLALFLPAFVAAIGYLQAKHKFCVAYGAAGTQNADGGSDSPAAVTDNDALAKDKERARILNLRATLVAAAATLVALTLPT